MLAAGRTQLPSSTAVLKSRSKDGFTFNDGRGIVQSLERKHDERDGKVCTESCLFRSDLRGKRLLIRESSTLTTDALSWLCFEFR